MLLIISEFRCLETLAYFFLAILKANLFSQCIFSVNKNCIKTAYLSDENAK